MSDPAAPCECFYGVCVNGRCFYCSLSTLTLGPPDAHTALLPLAPLARTRTHARNPRPLIDSHGSNSIVVVAGANNLLTVAEVESFEGLVASSFALVCQLEVTEVATVAALALARRLGVFTVMNSAPAPASLPLTVYELSDVFCANETEAETLTGVSVSGTDGAVEAGHALLARGCGVVVLTLGAAGAMIVGRGEDGSLYSTLVPAPVVPVVVDTSGAGDSFVGTFALVMARAMRVAAGGAACSPALVARALASRALLVHAATVACAASSISVTRAGTQKSYPSAEELPTGALTVPAGLCS